MRDFLMLVGLEVLERIAAVREIAVPGNIDGAAPDARDGMHDENHVHDEDGVRRRAGFRMADALNELLNDGHFALLRVVVALVHFQGALGIGFAQDAQRLSE